MKLFRYKIQLTLLLIAFISSTASAQKPGTTLPQQYIDVVVKSGNYNGFKEIRQDKIELFWKNIQDTLVKEKQLLNEAKARLGNVDQEIAKAKTATEQAEAAMAEAQARKDQINLLGIPMEKASYNMLMWGIVLLLVLALVFAIYRSKSAVTEARYRTGLFNDLTDEFQKHKVSANDKEKKLARELQTERNKLAELTGR